MREYILLRPLPSLHGAGVRVYIAGDTSSNRQYITHGCCTVCGRVRVMSVHCKNKLVVMTCGLKEVDKPGFFFLFVVMSGHGVNGCDYRGSISHKSLVTNSIRFCRWTKSTNND